MSAWHKLEPAKQGNSTKNIFLIILIDVGNSLPVWAANSAVKPDEKGIEWRLFTFTHLLAQSSLSMSSLFVLLLRLWFFSMIWNNMLFISHCWVGSVASQNPSMLCLPDWNCWSALLLRLNNCFMTLRYETLCDYSGQPSINEQACTRLYASQVSYSSWYYTKVRSFHTLFIM